MKSILEINHATLNRNSKLLILHAEPAYLNYLRNCIRAMNVFEIFEAGSADECLKIALQQQPVVLVYDVFLMGQTIETNIIKSIRDRLTDRLFFAIGLSASGSSDDMIKAYQSGADFFLAQNFSRFELSSILRNILRLNHEYRQRIEQEMRYRSIFEMAEQAMLLINLSDARIIAFNKAALSLYGYLPEEIKDRKMNLLAVKPAELTKGLKNKKTFIGEMMHKNALDRYFPVSISIHYYEDALQNVALLGIKEKEVLPEIFEADKRLYNDATLLSAFLLGEKTERQRISREIHDHAGQLLVSLKMELESFAETASLAENRKVVTKIRDGLVYAIRDLRNITASINRELLPGNSLATAVKNLVKWISEKHKFQINLTLCKLPAKIPLFVQANIYRIVEESLTNALKYSTKRKVDIVFSKPASNRVKLSIVSHGLPGSYYNINPGMGIKIMQQRAGLIGASITHEAGQNNLFVTIIEFS